MTFGASSHRAENYWFFGIGRSFDSDVADPKNRGLYGFATPGMTESEDRHNRRSCPPTKEHMDGLAGAHVRAGGQVPPAAGVVRLVDRARGV
jgi:alpha-L-fucosidase